MKRGVERLREYPQLSLTIFVALAIVGSFIFVAFSFLGIAQNAQDELINVRIGSLQDSFAPLASELWQEPETLRSYMRELQDLNPTILDFDIVESTSTGEWLIVRSADPSREGQQFFRQDLFLKLARSTPDRSFTTEVSENGTRYFYTARAVRTRAGITLGVVVTRQTLSAADEAISSSIQNATAMLVVVLLLLLLLFFRHARIIDYTVLYRKLREVDTLKDEFIAMASHELRAPLTAIRGYAEMLQSGKADEATKAQSVRRIDTSAQQLDTLIADMLDVSRIEQGRMKIEPKRLDSKQALEELCDTWEMRAKEKHLTLVRELADGLSITVDPDRFRQIVINLLSNAVKYTNRGSITVRTSTADGRFLLHVSDTGIGMTEEERGKLFAKFYRALGEEVRKESGTGLGLWITKEIISAMGGTISVESIKGVGSHFIVIFPVGA
jgi:signal transduction histidine kinase